MSRRVAALLAIVAIATAAAWSATRPAAPEAAGPSAAVAPADAPAVLYWYDPMRPEVHFERPGKSPFMDMQLVPKYAGPPGDPDTGVVRIDPAMAASLGIRTAVARTGTLTRSVVVPARVTTDERTLRRVTARVAGWVETLHVRAEGDRVTRGQPLATIYSPALAAAQRELALALASGESGLVQGARQRLRTLGVSADRIAAGESTGDTSGRAPITVPADGYLTRLAVREGDAVSSETAVAEFVSHDPIWVVADVPEVLAVEVAVGQAARIRVPAHPGHVLAATVDYVYPELDAATRTRRARLVVANAGERLHPGMYAEVTLALTLVDEVLLVPTEALIRTGRRTVVIGLDDRSGFRPVDVTPGAEGDDETSVTAGLKAGDRVVVSGQFLFDSEASLRGAYRRLGPGASPAATAPEQAP